MNKIELRKLNKRLTEIHEPSRKITVWPDDGPPQERHGAGTMKGSPIPPPIPPLAPNPIQSSHGRFFKRCTRTAFLPSEEHLDLVLQTARNESTRVPLKAIILTFSFLKSEFTAIHYRLARAVQPTGKTLDPLAATIGAIRLKDKDCSMPAALHLSEMVIKAFQENDKATLSRIQKLSTSKLGSHRNYQIWIAYDACSKAQAGKATTTGSQAENHNDNENALCANTADYRNPTTSDIKRYVLKRPSNRSFDKLPKAKDLKGWTRLWKDSGAYMVIPKGVRAKKMSGTK